MEEISATRWPFGDLDPASIPGVRIVNHGGHPETPHNFSFPGVIDELKFTIRHFLQLTNWQISILDCFIATSTACHVCSLRMGSGVGQTSRVALSRCWSHQLVGLRSFERKLTTTAFCGSELELPTLAQMDLLPTWVLQILYVRGGVIERSILRSVRMNWQRSGQVLTIQEQVSFVR